METLVSVTEESHVKKNANTKICTLLELADKRERVEHNPTVFEKREMQTW